LKGWDTFGDFDGTLLVILLILANDNVAEVQDERNHREDFQLLRLAKADDRKGKPELLERLDVVNTGDRLGVSIFQVVVQLGLAQVEFRYVQQ